MTSIGQGSDPSFGQRLASRAVELKRGNDPVSERCTDNAVILPSNPLRETSLQNDVHAGDEIAARL